MKSRRCDSGEQVEGVSYVVNSPKRIQRKMLNNLRRAAVSRINPALAAKANEILARLSSEPVKIEPAAENISILTKMEL